MGAFYTEATLTHHVHRKRTRKVPKLLVATGSEYTWIHAATLEALGVTREKKDLSFVLANGQTVTRSVGFAILRVDSHFTIDEVIFAEPGDLELLGTRTLEGLGLVPDPRRKKLVASGPLPAAGSDEP